MIRSLLVAVLLLAASPAVAQELDLSHGGPIGITAANGIEWRQAEQEVIARGSAQAVRDGVTVTADELIAWYRKKAGAAAAAPPAQGGLTGETDTAGSEIYRVQADGHVHIYTATDQAWGDRATYDLDQGVMVMTGRHLKLTTPNEILTARDDLEYWAQKHMAVARGDAVVITKDDRRLGADTLVAYTSDTPPPPGSAPAARPVAAKTPAGSPPADDPLGASGKLQKVEAYGHVSIRTPTDMVTGDRAVYVPDTGFARIGGHVMITRGQNQLNGSEAEVNMKTGISRLLSVPSGRVAGLVVPNDKTNPQLDTDIVGPGPQPAKPAGSKK
jgi:lipopolysaccharide export system protein LptA